ncbi:hypothetical protein E5161_02395 [Cohnella pontilimi]|uniref:Glycosyltransferase family 2 protein n=1 Tax=Cohnella pontilimi TaxID=2564100 RepID=A0A4U0FH30_9BACL|nr:hypothetical protein [Cohnella pontilimi]TJY44257.1 hypothetical protein E5161_02395 [Cohnella pontilimi]
MICFVILASEDKEETLLNQIENLRAFHPECKIVLYNGSSNKHFGRSAEVHVCPDSRPLQRGKQARFYMDIMRWLEQIDLDYEYLVNLDSETLFIRSGYEKYLQFIMRGYDYMGIATETISSPEQYPQWVAGQMMWKEWGLWKPVLQADSFCVSYHTNQVFKKSLVRSIVRKWDWNALERLMESTEVPSLEKILWPTIASLSGARLRPYLWESVERTFKVGEHLDLEEVRMAVLRPHVYFVHPVHGDMADPARKWISEIVLEKAR